MAGRVATSESSVWRRFSGRLKVKTRSGMGVVSLEGGMIDPIGDGESGVRDGSGVGVVVDGGV